MIAIACNTKLINNNKTWVMDSGATKHMCTERKGFMNLDQNKQSTVYIAMKYSTKSIDTGKVILNVRLNKREKI